MIVVCMSKDLFLFALKKINPNKPFFQAFLFVCLIVWMYYKSVKEIPELLNTYSIVMHTISINTYHVLLQWLTVLMYTTLYTTYMPCLVVVVDCIHVHNIVHYIHAMSCCCGCLYPCTQHCTLHTCHVLLLWLPIPMYTTLYTIHMPCLVAVVAYTHVHNIVHYTHAMSCCCS